MARCDCLLSFLSARRVPFHVKRESHDKTEVLNLSNSVNAKEEFDAVHVLSKELAKSMDELKALKKNGGKT